MAYIGFVSFREKITPLKQTKVLGATHTIDDESFISMLNDTEVDTLNTSENNIRHAIDSIVSSSSVGEEDSYMKLIAKEIVKINENPIITIVVKKGDTLASLAEEYYGDSSAYDKIINANRRLTQASHTIYVGESINLPY
jgi:nucleoid-associated protein YgaU